MNEEEAAAIPVLLISVGRAIRALEEANPGNHQEPFLAEFRHQIDEFSKIEIGTMTPALRRFVLDLVKIVRTGRWFHP